MKISRRKLDSGRKAALGNLHDICADLPGLVFIDLETARFSEPSSIIEVGVLILRPGMEPEIRHAMAQPGGTLEPRAQLFHGIAAEEFSEADTPANALESLLGDLQGMPWVAHNADSMETAAIHHWKPEWNPLWIDSLFLAYLLQPALGSHSLESLLQHFGLEFSEKHRALEDAIDTARVLSELFRHLGNSLSTETLEKMSEDLALERPGESLLLKTWVPQGARRHTFSAGPVDRSVTRSGVDTVEELFGSKGLGKVFPGYSPRCGQLEAARHIHNILEERRRAGVEAPTGTGKTLAILGASAQIHKETGKPVFVSSLSRALQEQAIDKDGPLIEKIMGVRLAMLMGKDNYLCRQRALSCLEKGRISGAAKALIRSMMHLESGWIYSNLSYAIRRDQRFDYDSWGHSLTARYGGCNPSAKKHLQCGYTIASSKAESAGIVVMNHWVALSPPKNIPDPAGIIFDEAHSLGDAIQQKETWKFSAQSLEKDFPLLQANLSASVFANYCNFVEQLLDLELEWDRRFKDDAFEPIGSDEDAERWSRFRETVKEVGEEISARVEELKEDEKENYSRLEAILEFRFERWENLQQFLNIIQHGEPVHWVFSRMEDRSYGASNRVTAVRPLFNDQAFDRATGNHPGIALVSATLGTASRPDHVLDDLGIRPDIGMAVSHLMVMEDPFPREEQLEVVVIQGIYDQRRSERHLDTVCEVAHRVACQLEGRTLLYSPNRKRADYYRSQLSESLLGTGVSLAPPSTQAAAEALRQDRPVIAVGSDGLGTGVDIPGEGLSALVIEGIPFPAKDAVRKARIDYRHGSYDAFLVDSLAPALIKTKQIAGRLLRTPQDKGVIFLVDPLVTEKGYSEEVNRTLHSKEWRVIDCKNLKNDIPEICSAYSRKKQVDH